MLVFGTRPEAIKMAPVIQLLQKSSYQTIICVTAQHRQMLDQVLELFRIKPDYDLHIMTERQTLEHVHASVLSKLQPVLQREQPDFVLVQGDTTTAFVAALAAYYRQIPVGHIEAGLRTNNKYSPFPEEINRRLISQIATIHFAATDKAKANLLACGIAKDKIFVTGNTVIDALQWVTAQKYPFVDTKLTKLNFKNKKIILVTTHRRENLGAGMGRIFSAIAKLAQYFKDVVFVFPVHLNPAIQNQANKHFAHIDNVLLIAPLIYSDLVNVMAKSYLILTDSGGIQEEAPSLGKPVVVLRYTTERQEGIDAGTAVLVGSDESKIYDSVANLLTNKSEYNSMAKVSNPYGDGKASQRIVKVLASS